MEKILNEKQVREMTTLCRTTRWQMAKEGRFPAPVSISKGRMGWLASDIQGWIEGRFSGQERPAN